MAGRAGQMMTWRDNLRARRVAMATAHRGAQELASSKRARLPKRNLQIGAMISDVFSFVLQRIGHFCKFVLLFGVDIMMHIDLYKYRHVFSVQLVTCFSMTCYQYFIQFSVGSCDQCQCQ